MSYLVRTLQRKATHRFVVSVTICGDVADVVSVFFEMPSTHNCNMMAESRDMYKV